MALKPSHSSPCGQGCRPFFLRSKNVALAPSKGLIETEVKDLMSSKAKDVFLLRVLKQIQEHS